MKGFLFGLALMFLCVGAVVGIASWAHSCGELAGYDYETQPVHYSSEELPVDEIGQKASWADEETAAAERNVAAFDVDKTVRVTVSESDLAARKREVAEKLAEIDVSITPAMKESIEKCLSHGGAVGGVGENMIMCMQDHYRSK